MCWPTLRDRVCAGGVDDVAPTGEASEMIASVVEDDASVGSGDGDTGTPPDATDNESVGEADVLK